MLWRPLIDHLEVLRAKVEHPSPVVGHRHVELLELDVDSTGDRHRLSRDTVLGLSAAGAPCNDLEAMRSVVDTEVHLHAVWRRSDHAHCPTVDPEFDTFDGP